MSKKAISTVMLLVLLLFVFSNSTPAFTITNNEDQQELDEEQLKEDTIEKKREERGVLKDYISGDLLPFLIGHEEYVADRFIIKYKEHTVEKTELQYQKELGDKLSEIKKINDRKGQTYEVVVLNREIKAEEFIDGIKEKAADIEYIQPDYQLNLLADDPYFADQWGLQNSRPDLVRDHDIPIFERLRSIPPHIREILENHPELKELIVNTPPKELRDKLMMGNVPGDVHPEILVELAHEPLFRERKYSSPAQQEYACDAGVVEAWEKSLGEGVIVAVIDTGIDVYHEDLTENIWVNVGEIPDNGIDDDGNGYVDDVFGWNFCKNHSAVYDTVNSENEKHGTHIAGIIAAVKDNGKGIVGAAPGAKIMPIKVFENGTAYTSDIIAAIGYAETMGARIVNCGWGSIMDNPALKKAMENSDMLFVCAAGNSKADIAATPVYPASFHSENIVSVASVNKNGLLSAFSNYGASCVEVSAPGEEILSTTPGNTYGNMSGTSMAAAFVSAEAALLLAMDNSLSPAITRGRIISYSDRLSSLTDRILSGNKINFTNVLHERNNDELIIVEDVPSGEPGNPILPDSEGFVLFNVPSTGLLSVIQVTGGYYHSIALKEDGTVWSWGSNEDGQLGDGTITQRTTPVQVSGLTGGKAISGGAYHSLSLKEDGTVWAWGNGIFGQLGDGTTYYRITPVQANGLTYVKAIAAGSYHSLALKEDGTVWAWGLNSSGQLGDGTTTDRTTPVQISGLTEVKAIAAGSHSLALKEDGTVWAWGYNSSGQLGDGTTTSRNTPVQVSGLTGVKAITCGVAHSLALREDGTVWAWGNNFGSTPIQVSGLTNVKALAGGWQHSLVLKEDGTAWAWGNNEYGQLGDGTTTQRSTPVQISSLTTFQAVASGGYHGLALKEGGTVWAWGNNYYGQLGNGGMLNSSYPLGTYGTPPDLAATLTDTELDLSYGLIGGTTYYELKVDGIAIDNGLNTTYTYPLPTPGHLPAYRVRSINASGPGLWSINAPSAGLFGAITTDSIEVSWSANGNPDGTLYKIAAYDTNNILAAENDWTETLADTITGFSENTAYMIKIKAKNEDHVQTGWQEIGLATTVFTPFLSPALTINCTAEEEYLITTSLQGISTFAGAEFTVIYDPAMLELIDFAVQTKDPDQTIGAINGTDIKILSHTGGAIRFRAGKALPADKIWSGTINIFKFRAIQNGPTLLTLENGTE